MRDEYDFSKMDWKKNPYADKLKQQITIRLGNGVVAYFKEMAKETGIPYQNLINLYLEDCVRQKKKLAINWEE